MLLFATNGYLHYRLATERTVSWRWMLALNALDVAMLSAGVVAHRGFETTFFVGYYQSSPCSRWSSDRSGSLSSGSHDDGGGLRSALPRGRARLDFLSDDEEILLIRVAGMYLVVVVVNPDLQGGADQKDGGGGARARLER